MISKAIAKYIRISPKKTRQIVDLIRGKNPHKALAILANTKKIRAGYVAKVLKSAIANVSAKQDIKQEDLYISKIIVDGGPVLKRFRPRAMGRASPVLKRTSHIRVELDRKPSKLKPVLPGPKVKTKAAAPKVKTKAKAPKVKTNAKAIKKAKHQTK